MSQFLDSAQRGTGVPPISINLIFKRALELFHLARSAVAVFCEGLRDGCSPAQQVTKRQRHSQGREDAIPDFLEDEPAAFLATTDIPRGKKNARHGSCARSTVR